MCRDHDLSFRAIIELVPELRTKMFVATSDNEFTPLLSNHFKGAFVAKCENHLSKQIGRYVMVFVNLNTMDIITINIIVIVNIIIIVMVRWCEIKGKATKAEVSFYKNEFRLLFLQWFLIWFLMLLLALYLVLDIALGSQYSSCYCSWLSILFLI